MLPSEDERRTSAAVAGMSLSVRMRQLQALSVHAEDSAVWLELGECYFYLGDYERAAAVWEKIQHYKEAEKWLRYYRSAGFQYWLKRFHQSVRAMERQQYAEARQLIYQLLSEFDRSVLLFQLLGCCALAQGDVKAAEEAWRQGLRLDPRHPELNRYMRRMHALSLPASDRVATAASTGRFRRIRQFLGGLWKRSYDRIVFAVGSIILCLALGSQYIADRGADRYLAALNLPKQEENDWQAPANDARPGSSSVGAADGYAAAYAAYLSRDFLRAEEGFTALAGQETAEPWREQALFYAGRCCFKLGAYAQAERFFMQYLQQYGGGAWTEFSWFYAGLSAARLRDAYTARLFLARITDSALRNQPAYRAAMDVREVIFPAGS
jgi:TolA-binding protein